MENHFMLSPAYELADGDEAFYSDLLESMAVSITDDINEIEKALEQKHLNLARRGAHHMKSSVMYTNAAELKGMLILIETKNESPLAIEEIQSIMPKLKTLAMNLKDIIKGEKTK